MELTCAHKAIAEACEPKMLNATIGFNVIDAGAEPTATAGAALIVANADVALIKIAAPHAVIFLVTPPSIDQFPLSPEDS